MPNSRPDERLVYLALKNTFRGTGAQVRKLKKVRELILKEHDRNELRDLIEEHDIDSVCSVAKGLLEEEIFESTQRAKLRFPEVFDVSPVQTAERSASEAEAARSEADAIRIAAEGPSASEAQNVRSCGGDDGQASRHDSAGPTRKRPFLQVSISVPSLYPVYLPYRTQHQLLTKVQTILEKACYDFATGHLKSVLEREAWDCAEAGELNLWIRHLKGNKDKLEGPNLEALERPVEEIFDSLTELRHTAVHRVRISTNRLEQFMLDAETLTWLLNVEHCTQKLSQLRMEVQFILDELKRNKDVLESKLNSKLGKIAAQRAELDRLERLAIEDMIKEDIEYQILAGSNVEEVLRLPESDRKGKAKAEMDSEAKSDAEVDDDMETDFEAANID